VDGLWATKSEGVGLIVVAIGFQDFQPMSSRVPIHKRHKQTDGQTDDMQSHRAVKSYYGWPIGTHQRSFERYHPRPPKTSPSPRLGVRNANPKKQSLLSQELVNIRTSNLAGTFTGSIRSKAHKKIWRKGSVGVSRDFPYF